jgi:iron complex transport system substrate-binding protein
MSFCGFIGYAHVLSVDLCADQWVLWFLPPQDIVAVSYLAKDPHLSYLEPQSRNLDIHTGSLESILKHKPKLVVADSFLDPLKKEILEHRGIKVLVLKPLQSLEDIKERLSFLGKLWGQEEKAKKAIQEIEEMFPKNPKILSIFLGAGRISPGKKTWISEMMDKGGYRNIVQFEEGWKYVPLEKVVFQKPIMIFGAEEVDGQETFSAQIARQLKKGYKGFPQKVLLCPIPSVLNELHRRMSVS